MQPGERLGPYEIVAVLGAGGMGDVSAARDTRLGDSQPFRRNFSVRLNSEAPGVVCMTWRGNADRLSSRQLL